MGLVRTTLTLANPKHPDLAPIEVQALVDMGAVQLCIPERVAIQLDLDELERREVTVANGSTHSVPYVGPIVTAFRRRHCYTVLWFWATKFCSVPFLWKTWTSSCSR